MSEGVNKLVDLLTISRPGQPQPALLDPNKVGPLLLPLHPNPLSALGPLALDPLPQLTQSNA